MAKNIINARRLYYFSKSFVGHVSYKVKTDIPWPYIS